MCLCLLLLPVSCRFSQHKRAIQCNGLLRHNTPEYSRQTTPEFVGRVMICYDGGYVISISARC